MMLKLSALLTIGLIVIQAVDFRLSRFGSVGRSLSDAEVVEITRLANAAGKTPWLIIGFPSMITGVASITVYLEPSVTNPRVCRGGWLRLTANQPPSLPERGPWSVKDTGSYAYVTAPGGRVGEIADERDIAWPFAVEDEIDDDTLISVVTFIRSKPKIPGVPEGQAPRQVAGGTPISAVARRTDGIIVALRTSEATGQRVTLIPRDGRWVITHVESWIV